MSWTARSWAINFFYGNPERELVCSYASCSCGCSFIVINDYLFCSKCD